jgi:hypothetical protein
MVLTWIAIIASLLMGGGAVLIFIFAVKKDYFRNLEETKYQVFWSDVEELVESARGESHDEHFEEGFNAQPGNDREGN